MPEPWVSADVISEHLGVTEDSIFTWIAKKDMPAHRVGRLWKFKVTEIDAWALEPRVIERGLIARLSRFLFHQAPACALGAWAQSLQQDGPPPKVIRSTVSPHRDSLAVSEAERLLSAYPAGTFAVIAVDTDVNGCRRLCFRRDGA